MSKPWAICTECKAKDARIAELEEVNRKQNLEIMRLLNDKKELESANAVLVETERKLRLILMDDSRITKLERIVELARNLFRRISTNGQELSNGDIKQLAIEALAQIEEMEKK